MIHSIKNKCQDRRGLLCDCACDRYKDKSHLLHLLNKINLVMSYDKTTISTAKQITCNWSCVCKSQAEAESPWQRGMPAIPNTGATPSSFYSIFYSFLGLVSAAVLDSLVWTINNTNMTFIDCLAGKYKLQMSRRRRRRRDPIGSNSPEPWLDVTHSRTLAQCTRRGLLTFASTIHP